MIIKENLESIKLPELDIERWSLYKKIINSTNFTPKEASAVVEALFELKEHYKIIHA